MPTTWQLVSGYTNPDTYTRADGAVGNGWLATGTGTFSIASNKLTIANASNLLYRPSSEASQDQRHVYRFIAGNNYSQTLVRFDGSNNGYQASCGSTGDANVYINTYISGAFTNLGAAITTSGFIGGKTYEIDLAATGINPTTITLTVTNITDSVVMVNAATRTNSTSILQVATGRPALGGYGSGTFTGVSSATYAASFAASPSTTVRNSTGNVVTLTGIGTSWTPGTPGSPTFTLSGGTGASITAQSVSSSTSATITVSAGSATGTLTITDPANSTTATITVLPTPILPNDANIITSPYNAEFNGSSWVQSNTPGFYQRFKLTGATYLYATFDVSALVAQGATSGQYPAVKAIVNDKLTSTVQLTSGTTEVQLASNLTGTPSEVFVYYYSPGDDNLNKWAASGNNSIRLVSYRTDGTLIAPAARAKKAIVFGDSITEGNAGQNALESFAAMLGVALNSDYGQIGFGSQGWNWAGNGSVPVFSSSWNLQRSGVSRSFTTQPDYIVVCQGTNDALNSVSDSTVTTNATSTLRVMRTACPNAWIFVVVPFGQFKQSALAAATTAAAHPKTVLIDLGVEASRGITASALGASIYSLDGIHPTTYNNGRLATLLTAAIQAKISAIPTRRSLKL